MTATALTAAPQNIQVGAGFLFTAALGSTVPTDLTTAWDAAWIPVGLTDAGHTFNSQRSTGNIEAAEVLPPVKIMTTGMQDSVQFAMMEITATNLARAFNGGTSTTGSGIVTYTPPPLGSEVRKMLGWEAEDHTERWIWYQALNTGNVSIARQKAPNKSLIPVTFSLELPAGQNYTWKAIEGTSVVSGATSRG